ncbi:hypothetical protein J6590_069192 [Homalodisca vitripennis]|nr:hypothetical protein J6590_069192 [Homalodisca vitripennis]
MRQVYKCTTLRPHLQTRPISSGDSSTSSQQVCHRQANLSAHAPRDFTPSFTDTSYFQWRFVYVCSAGMSPTGQSFSARATRLYALIYRHVLFPVEIRLRLLSRYVTDRPIFLRTRHETLRPESFFSCHTFQTAYVSTSERVI